MQNQVMESAHTTFDRPLSLSLAPALLRSVEAAAAREGVSVAEFARHALIRQLIEDDSADQPKRKFGPHSVRLIDEIARRDAGVQKNPGDSTEIIRAARDGWVDKLP